MFPDKSIITGANNFSIISVLSMSPLTDKARPISSKKTISDLVSRPKITPSTSGA